MESSSITHGKFTLGGSCNRLFLCKTGIEAQTNTDGSIHVLFLFLRQGHLYYNYEKYPLSPLKPNILALIEQYLPNISDPVYSVHQSFIWFLWLNWRKSTFYPVTAPNDSKCSPIVTSSLQEPVASNCDVTMTDCSRVVSMDAFLTQWCWDVDREHFLL